MSQAARRPRRDARSTAVIGALAVAVLVLAGLNLAMGAASIAPGEVAGALARRLGLSWFAEPGPGAESVVWTLRMPRMLLATVVGAALAAGGAALQGAFRNPLSDPHLLGIGPGAAIGAAIGAVALGAVAAVAAGAVAGVAIALALRYLASRVAGDPARFILVGVALGAALTAWLGFIVFASDRSTVPPVEFWILGSLSAATWRVLWVTIVIVAIGVTVLLALSRSIDLLALGEKEASLLGLNVPVTVLGVLAAVGALTGATVGAAGVVGFVGLVLPNALRPLVGPGHRRLLGVSMLGGAAFVLAADLVARTALAPIEIAVGLLTALVGGPFLLVQLSRARLA